MNRRVAWAAAAAIVLVALLLRVQHANMRRSVWGDESNDLRMIRTSDSLAELNEKIRIDGPPPLHYWMEWVILQTAGEKVLRSRWPYLILGTAAVALVLLLGWRWFGWRCGLLCGLLAATSPIQIHYSAEIRNYALLAATGPIFGLAFLRFFDRRDRSSAALWGAASALISYTHYFGLFAVIAAGIWYLAHDRTRAGLLRIVVAGATFLVLFAPWLPSFIWQLGRDQYQWGTPDTDPAEILRALRLTVAGRGWIILLASLVVGGVIAYRAREKRSERRAFFALVTVSLGATMLAWAFQLGKGAWMNRYLLAYSLLILPPACLYISRMGAMGDVTWWRGRRTGRAYRMPARVHGAIGLLLVLALLAFQWQDRRGWRTRRIAPYADYAEQIETQGKPTDLIVVSPTWIHPSLGHHYRGGLPMIAPPFDVVDGRLAPAQYSDDAARDAGIETRLSRIRAHLRGGGRVWILYNSCYRDRDAELGNAFQGAQLKKIARIVDAARESGVIAKQVLPRDGQFRYPIDLLLFEPR